MPHARNEPTRRPSPRRRTAYETHPTIYACSTGSYGIDAELKRGSNVDASASATVSVSADIPGTPVGLTARPGDGSITLSWNPPADDGGNPITEYRIRYKRDGTTTSQNPYVRVRKLIGPSVRSHALTGLANGQGYTVHVWAVNANGEGIANRAEITGATPIVPPIGIVWQTTISPEQNEDKYGYDPIHNRIGSITDRTFSLNGKENRIFSIIWEDQTEQLKLEFYTCLSPSDVFSLKIGNQTFNRPDTYRNDDFLCADRYQGGGGEGKASPSMM